MSSESTQNKKKRTICSRCHRPAERTCICKALPDTTIALSKCELIILQHPHEIKRKNRSLPLVELCVEEQNIHKATARRFGDQIDDGIMQLLHDSTRQVMVVYPSQDAVSLTQGLEKIRQHSGEEKKITVVILDGTWKHCREMNMANEAKKQYPPNIIKVALSSQDLEANGDFRPARFDIRTPPSPEHLSTAECIAWIVAKIENEPLYYDTIMKPLDLMVEQWHSFSNRGTFSFTSGDGKMAKEAKRKEEAVTASKKRKHED